MSKYQEAYDIIFNELIPMPELNDIDKKRLFDSMDLLQELIDLHKKIEEDIEFLKSENIKMFIFPNGRKILGYDITECPSENRFNEILRKKIEDNLLNFWSDENDK